MLDPNSTNFDPLLLTLRQDSRDIVSLRIIKAKIWRRHRHKPGPGGGLLLHHHVPVFFGGNCS
jgi:hypothetical protein